MVPCIAVLTSVVALSYSRSAVLAAIIGVAIWLAAVPRRLRSVLVLALGCAAAAVIAGWALGEAAFAQDGVSLSTRVSEGRTFALVLVLTLAVVAVLGFFALRYADGTPLDDERRRRVGIALLCLLALVPVLGVAKEATSSRGLGGETSHIWSELTTTGHVSDNSARLSTLSNSRPAYWHEGMTVGEHAVVVGVGADGFATAQTRYSDDALRAENAHSYLVQTFADLGLIGLALSVALLVAWLMSAARPLRGAGDELQDEHAGMWSLLCVVFAFGASSTIDWTWFYPGLAVPALIAAGWLAGRGPLTQRIGMTARMRIGVVPRIAATALGVVAILVCWAIWQPLRSVNANSAAIAALTRGDAAAALADARSATSSDPLAVTPLWTLSGIDMSLDDHAAALSELLAAVNLQPQNPQTWMFLGQYYLGAHMNRKAAAAFAHAHTLDLAGSFPTVSPG